MAIDQFTTLGTDTSHVQLDAPTDGAPIQLADPSLIFKGEYSRSGHDLEIAGPDGNTVTVEGYFASSTPSAIMAPNGAMLNGDVVEALAGPLFPGQYAQTGGAGQGNPIGEVQHLQGTATATRTDGSVVELAEGTKVYLGDVVETGANTKFGLSLEDGSLFSMTSDARMVLNEFVFNGDQAQDSSMLVNLVQGAFVFVAGSIAPSGNMKVETPVAVLAIRGTTVGAEVDNQLGSSEFSLFNDLGTNDRGEYLVLDKAGKIIGKVTEVGNKLIITGPGVTPIIVEKTTQDFQNDQAALDVLKALLSKVTGQPIELDGNSGSGSFQDIQIVGLARSLTIEELAGNPKAAASATKIVFDTPDKDDPPVAFFDGFSTDEDDTFAGNVISNTSIQEDEDPEGFDVRVVGFGEDLIWEEGVDFDFDGGIIASTGSTTFVLTSGAIVEINAQGDFTYNPSPAFDYLGAGESAVDSFTYLIADPGNFTDSDTVEVTVVGDNDRPVVVSIEAQHADGITETVAVQDSTVIRTASGVVEFQDVDSTDTHNNATTTTPVFQSAIWDQNGSTSDVSISELGSVDLTFSYSIAPATAQDPTLGPVMGQVAWEFSVADQDIDFLADGETLDLTYRIFIQDDSGTSTDTTFQDIAITITGTNDIPVITAGDVSETRAETEGDILTGGSFAVLDVDVTDVVTISDISVATGDVDGAAPDAATLLAMFSATPGTVIADGDTTGTVSWEFASGTDQFDYLAEGELLTVTYTVTVDDGNLGTATQDIIITITGTNDAAIVAVQPVVPEGSVTEDVALPTLESTGSIGFTDVDLSDTHIVSAEFTSSDHPDGTDVQLGGISSIVVSPDSTGSGLNGEIDWTYQVANADVQFLAEGEVITETYTITLDDENTDGQVTREIEVTITGVNDAALIAAQQVAPEGSVTEDTVASTLEAAGTIGFTDVDLIDSHIVSAEFTSSDHPDGTDVQLGGISSIVVSPDSTGSGLNGEIDWTYQVANADVQFLAEGEVITETYTITLDDENTGGQVTREIEVTITGVNDAAMIAAQPVEPEGSVTEDVALPTLEATGSIGFTDVDLIDSHIVSAEFTSSDHPDGTDVQLGGISSIVVSPDSTGTGLNGEIDWTYQVANADVQFLGEGEMITETYTITLDDENTGGQVTREIEVTITGVNDAAMIAAQPVEPEGSVTEDISTPTLESTGSIGFTDVDLTDGHIVSAEFTSSDHPDGTDVQLGGISSIVVSPDSTGSGLNGEIDWTYQVANADVQFLAEGEVITETYTITLDDENTGGQVTREIEITITGVNDAAMIAAQPVAPEGSVTEDTVASTLEAAGTIDFTDVDLIDSHIVSAEFTSSDHPDGTDVQLGGISSIVVSPDSTGSGLNGEIDWTYQVANADVQFLAESEVITEIYTITLDDENTGGQVTREIEVTITGVNDAAMIAAQPVEPEGSVTEDTITPTLEATGTIGFTDVDLTDGHIVSAEFTSSDHPAGSTVSLGSISSIVVSADTTGTGLGGEIDWTYQVANADVQFLGEGEVITETYTITLDDENTGGQVTREIEVTITGVNDAPEISAAEINAITLIEGDSVIEVAGNVSGSWSDADQGQEVLLGVVLGGSAGVTPQQMLTFDTGTGEAEITGTYGSLFIKADGAYRYVLDNSDPDTQTLTGGQAVSDEFNYTIANGGAAGDSATSTISVNITGTDDAAPALTIVDYFDEGSIYFDYANQVPFDAVDGFDEGQSEITDVFVIENIVDPEYSITGFVPTEDVLDLSALLSDPGFTDAAVEDYVKVVDDGVNTTIQVDADGAANGETYVDLATLNGVTGADEINIVTTPAVTS